MMCFFRSCSFSFLINVCFFEISRKLEHQFFHNVVIASLQEKTVDLVGNSYFEEQMNWKLSITSTSTGFLIEIPASSRDDDFSEFQQDPRTCELQVRGPRRRRRDVRCEGSDWRVSLPQRVEEEWLWVIMRHISVWKGTEQEATQFFWERFDDCKFLFALYDRSGLSSGGDVTEILKKMLMEYELRFAAFPSVLHTRSHDAGMEARNRVLGLSPQI